MLQKSKVLETVEDLPDRFSMDELFEKMYVIEKIEKGLEQVRNGETIYEEDLDEEIESWFK
jgi:hypothetical protein